MGRPKGGRGGQNSFGALKARLTLHAREYIREYQEEEYSRKTKEIEKNKIRWGNILDRLKIEDIEFENWYYNVSDIPDWINWTGEDFEVVFVTLKKRLNKIRQNRRNNDNR